METIQYLQGRLCSDGAGITVERAGRGLRLIIDIAKLSTIVAVRSILSGLKAVLGEDKSIVSAFSFNDPLDLSQQSYAEIISLTFADRIDA